MSCNRQSENLVVGCGKPTPNDCSTPRTGTHIVHAVAALLRRTVAELALCTRSSSHSPYIVHVMLARSQLSGKYGFMSLVICCARWRPSMKPKASKATFEFSKIGSLQTDIERERVFFAESATGDQEDDTLLGVTLPWLPYHPITVGGTSVDNFPENEMNRGSNVQISLIQISVTLLHQ